MMQENEADLVTQEVLQAIRRSFITPFDRGDIKGLITSMDDAIDQMNKTGKTIMLYEVTSFEEKMQEIGDVIVKSAKLTAEIVPLLRAMRNNSARLHKLAEDIVGSRNSPTTYNMMVQSGSISKRAGPIPWPISRDRKSTSIWRRWPTGWRTWPITSAASSSSISDMDAATLTPVLILLIAVALAFDFLNGLHDAANSIATVVSTRVLPPQYAVFWAAFFNFIAFLFFGLNVAKTVGAGIVLPGLVDDAVIFGALMGALYWNVVTWLAGIPSSSSHAVIGDSEDKLLHGVLLELLVSIQSRKRVHRGSDGTTLPMGTTNSNQASWRFGD